MTYIKETLEPKVTQEQYMLEKLKRLKEDNQSFIDIEYYAQRGRYKTLL